MIGGEGGSRTPTLLRGTNLKPVARVLTSFYCALPSSIYRRFSRQSKLRLAWYEHVSPSSSPHLCAHKSRHLRPILELICTKMPFLPPCFQPQLPPHLTCTTCNTLSFLLSTTPLN